MRKIMFLALLGLLLSVYAVPLAVQTTAELVGEAQTSAIVKKTYEVTVVSEVIPGVPEIIGKKYNIEISSKIPGVFIDANGDVVIPPDSISESGFKAMAAEIAKSSIAADLARIDHSRKFGGVPTQEQINSYVEYFDREFGQNYTKAYQAGKMLTVTNVSETIVITDDGKTYTATPVSKSSNLTLLSLRGTKSDGVLFPNISPDRGETVYLVMPAQADSKKPLIDTEVAVIVSAKNTSFELDRNVSAGTIAMNGDGKIIGIANNDGKTFLSSVAVASEISNSGLRSGLVETSASLSYRQAKEAYAAGDYEKALGGFEKTLSISPDHAAARYYLSLASEAEGSQTILYRLKKVHPAVLAILALGGAAFIVVGYMKLKGGSDRKSSKTRRSRGKYSASDDSDY